MDIQTVNDLFEEGFFSALYKAGFVTSKIFTYREIHLWVHHRMETQAVTKNQAVREAEIYFNRDERTIWRALGCFDLLQQSAGKQIRDR